ncbi:hypothetical protein AAFF27_25830 [Xylophilus sp. GW821-FHT01B05]
MLRRISLFFLLSLALLFSQQGALLHELGHLLAPQATAAAEAAGQPGSPDSARAVCEKCLAFAQLADAVPSHWALPLPEPQHLRAVVPCPSGSADLPAPPACSRGPPRFL